MEVLVFIQARMSSSRFPGKVLAPVNGAPMISRVIDGVARACDKRGVVVATSDEASDEPLAVYVQSLGIKVFRGPLNDVFKRFRLCLQDNPCEWFFRVSADSPLLNSGIMKTMLPLMDSSLDLITNVQKRTFPHGQSVELLNADRFRQIDAEALTGNQREHVTKYYYDHAREFRILNIEATDPSYSKLDFVVDTLADLRRVEEMESKTPHDFIPAMEISTP
jgi:spore coat polysaccharide biosynthesis protein SpsF